MSESGTDSQFISTEGHSWAASCQHSVLQLATVHVCVCASQTDSQVSMGQLVIITLEYCQCRGIHIINVLRNEQGAHKVLKNTTDISQYGH